MKDVSPKQESAAHQEQLRKTQRRLDRLSRLLDDAFTLPVVNIKIGWDAIIGLIPVVGDVVGALLSFYLVLQAARLKLGAFTILRMLINIGIELLLGIVPVLGDFFDVTWRANRKNYELIEQHLARKLPRAEDSSSTEPSKEPSTARKGNGRFNWRTLCQAALALICAGVLYYLLLEWQAGHIVFPDDFYPAALLQRL